MSKHLLNAWETGDKALHTAADDLESFFWVLIWSLVCIFKKVATITNERSIILRLEAALSSHVFNDILRRDTLIRLSWHDKVFKGLIDDWQKILLDSQTIVSRLERILRFGGNRGAEISIFDELDKHCLEVYEEFIRKGYGHLQTIRMRFSSWKEVMDSIGNSL